MLCSINAEFVFNKHRFCVLSTQLCLNKYNLSNFPSKYREVFAPQEGYECSANTDMSRTEKYFNSESGDSERTNS